MTWILLALACDGGGGPNGKDGGTPVPAFPGGRVIDPKLAGASVQLEDGGCGATWTLTGGAAQVRTLQSGPWDGLDDDGVPFDPGAVRAVATCGESVEARLDVVRLGVATVDFVSGAADTNVPLAFHRRDLLTREVVEILGPEYRQAPLAALSPVDDDAGAARAAIPPWSDAMSPPWGDGDATDVANNVPAAYVAAAAPRVQVSAPSVAISAATGVPVDVAAADAPTLRLVVDGVATDWAPGATTTLDLSAVEATLGRESRAITWTWEAADGEGWTSIPGDLTTTHTLWRTAGPSQLRDGSERGFAPAVTWVGVLAETEDALTGVEADPAAVLDALRDHIHDSDWIIYDPNDGSYSSYVGEYIYWDYSWSNLSDWLDRSEGIRLYCHSVSCLFSTLAGHVGVRAPQQVLGVNFRTNLVRAAGTDTWSSWSFNSHSLVSPDDGATLWDASIALDGDGDPGSEPVTEVAPKGMTFEEYTRLMSRDEVEIVNSGLCFFE
jgi:hypothetical protein